MPSQTVSTARSAHPGVGRHADHPTGEDRAGQHLEGQVEVGVGPELTEGAGLLEE